MSNLYSLPRNDALQRLNQTLLQIDPYILPPYPNLSIVSGPLDPPLLTLTLGQLLSQQASLYPDNECLIIPWTGARWTYRHLLEESNLVARGLLGKGVRPGDRVGIMSGNCESYASVFFACARVGAICVTLNNTYTASEVENALKKTRKSLTPNSKVKTVSNCTCLGCKILFTTPKIGRFDNTPLLTHLQSSETKTSIPDLQTTCILRDSDLAPDFPSYEQFLAEGEAVPAHILDIFDGIISPYDVINLQFTSGSTGNPKAAMLTHQYVTLPFHIYFEPSELFKFKNLTKPAT